MTEDVATPVGQHLPATRPRRSRWWAVLVVLGLILCGWKGVSAPRHDSRMVGEWLSEKGTVWIFDETGRLEILQQSDRKRVWPGRPRWWRSEGDELVIGTQTLTSRARKWFDNLLRPWTRVQVIGLNDSRYKVVELNESRLQLPLVRKPPRPPVPSEVFTRVNPTKSPAARSK